MRDGHAIRHSAARTPSIGESGFLDSGSVAALRQHGVNRNTRSVRGINWCPQSAAERPSACTHSFGRQLVEEAAQLCSAKVRRTDTPTASGGSAGAAAGGGAGGSAASSATEDASATSGSGPGRVRLTSGSCPGLHRENNASGSGAGASAQRCWRILSVPRGFIPPQRTTGSVSTMDSLLQRTVCLKLRIQCTR